jgi:IMP dehydrogenase
MKKCLTFDDVLITPQYSKVRSRSDVDISVGLSKGLNFRIPVFPANMKTIVNKNVAEEMYKLGGLCLIHRFSSIEDQIGILRYLRGKYEDAFDYIGVSVGIKEEDYRNIKMFHDIGVNIICIDIAHGHSIGCEEMVKYISKNFPDIFLIAGNVATGQGAFDLWVAGADAVKVNVGAGSICTTRVTTGCGIPQLSALMDVHDMRSCNSVYLKDKFIIADGGCTKIGDLVKSLSLSEMVMTGNMFAGSTDGPGELIHLNGKNYKNYDGSSTHKSDFIEGVKALVEMKPSISDITQEMIQGILSGCSYVGAFNLIELQEKTKFVKITNAGVREGGAHDVKVVGKGE